MSDPKFVRSYSRVSGVVHSSQHSSEQKRGTYTFGPLRVLEYSQRVVRRCGLSTVALFFCQFHTNLPDFSFIRPNHLLPWSEQTIRLHMGCCIPVQSMRWRILLQSDFLRIALDDLIERNESQSHQQKWRKTITSSGFDRKTRGESPHRLRSSKPHIHSTGSHLQRPRFSPPKSCSADCRCGSPQARSR